MRFHGRLLLLILLPAMANLAHAEVYKCVGDNGRIAFSDRPCSDGQQTRIATPADGGGSRGRAYYSIDAAMMPGGRYPNTRGPIVVSRSNLENPDSVSYATAQAAGARWLADLRYDLNGAEGAVRIDVELTMYVTADKARQGFESDYADEGAGAEGVKPVEGYGGPVVRSSADGEQYLVFMHRNLRIKVAGNTNDLEPFALAYSQWLINK